MAAIRVLVVEDSLTVRKYLCETLGRDPEISVAGEAADGKRAIELCSELRPDVVTMDMMLPIMSGLAATEYIMAHVPTPILIVSASTNRGELFKTFEALAAGAVDVLEKPAGGDADDKWERTFISTVKLVSRIPVITHPRARLQPAGGESGAERNLAKQDSSPSRIPSKERCEVVAIGASTGGPGAVVRLLQGLPADFAVPILLVLHIGEPFGQAFAEWLDGQTARRVVVARDRDPVSAMGGSVIVAPPGLHLLVRNGRLLLDDGEERHSCRPSVDVLFESVAREFGSRAAACLLTGMGRDGAAGLLAVRRAGGLTIAQDETTSIVYGMPREAVLLDAAERVLPIHSIGPALALRASVPPRKP